MNFKVFSACFQIAGSSLPSRFYTSGLCLPSHELTAPAQHRDDYSDAVSLSQLCLLPCPSVSSSKKRAHQGKGFSHCSAVHIVGTPYLLKEQRRAIVYLFKKDLFYHLGVFLFYIFYFISTNVLPACVSVYYIYTWCLLRPEEGCQALRNWVAFGRKLPYR